MWYVGLDWADTHDDVDVLDEAGKRVGARRFPHCHEGLDELKQFVLNIVGSPEYLGGHRRNEPWIAYRVPAGGRHPVYPVNPIMDNQLRKTAGAKTEQIDAHLLAKMGRFDLIE